MPHNLAWYWSILFGFLLAEIASLATTAYLHRASAHRSVTFRWPASFTFELILWLTTGIKRDEWVAVHLKHHAHTDIPGDPHSPVLLGLWPVQLGNVFLYRNAIRSDKNIVVNYAKHIELSWAERNIFRSPILGLVFGITLLWYALGLVPMLIIAGTHTFLYVFVLNSLINGWCHVRGYKNFPRAAAFNNRLIAWLTGGEGLHNNHHEKPWNPSLRHKPSEVDLGWIFIRFLCFMKLARLARA